MKLRSSESNGVIGVIHARGGSKRIPLKNIKLLAGRPLISYMVEAAVESRLLDRVIVSTDQPEIARIINGNQTAHRSHVIENGFRRLRCGWSGSTGVFGQGT